MAFNCISCKSEIDPESKACPRCGDQITDFLRTYQQQLLDGKYQLLERLGRGGMGEVYKVLHTHLHTIRVVKVMRPQLTGDQSLHERFVREAKLATRIQHQNVATLHDFASLPDGSYYMIWEFIDGLNLAALIRRDGRLGIRTVIDIAIQTLHGLDSIHSAGIVHRDISPENIMVSSDSSGQLRVKLIDLGIAKSDAVDNSQTATGMFVGKWKYASPEHLGMMEPGEVIDGRADLYSFGIVLYEMLAGRPPFEATTPGQYLVVHSRETANPLVERPITFPDAPGLENVLRKALEKKRELRYANARELARALGEVLSRMQGVDDVPTAITPLPSYQGPTAPGSGGPALPTMMQTPTPPPGRPGAFDPTMAVPQPGAHAPTMAVPQPGAHAPTMAVPPPPPGPAYYQTTPGAAQPPHQTAPGAPQTVLTSPGVHPPKKSSSALFAVLGAAGALVLLLAGAGGWFLYKQLQKEQPEQAASTTATTATGTATAPPSGTILDVAVTPTTSMTTAAVPATETTSTLVELAPTTTTATVPLIPPTDINTRPPKTTTMTPVTRPPVDTQPPTTIEPEPEPPPADDAIATAGPFGRRSRKLVTDETYSRGFKRGIIRNYDDMWAGTDVDWASVARGVKLSQYAIKVGPFRNMTRYNSSALKRTLEVTLQDEFDGIAGSKGTLLTQNAIIWASDAEDGPTGLGIEMIFRDPSGRVVAKLRNFVRDYPPDDAAEEMLEQLTDFVEDHPVIK
ncbi:MAG: serine/threonine protein kinase [Acidobacteria bacterium]|nr:serine/threonine protein kinase [Acidobacteriota bacterium]